MEDIITLLNNLNFSPEFQEEFKSTLSSLNDKLSDENLSNLGDSIIGLSALNNSNEVYKVQFLFLKQLNSSSSLIGLPNYYAGESIKMSSIILRSSVEDDFKRSALLYIFKLYRTIVAYKGFVLYGEQWLTYVLTIPHREVNLDIGGRRIRHLTFKSSTLCEHKILPEHHGRFIGVFRNAKLTAIECKESYDAFKGSRVNLNQINNNDLIDSDKGHLDYIKNQNVDLRVSELVNSELMIQGDIMI